MEGMNMDSSGNLNPMNMGGSDNLLGGMDMGTPNPDTMTWSTESTQPWFMRSGPGRTGNFFGHFLPAIFFIGFSLVMLTIGLIRARALQPGQSFTALYIPETNPKILRRVGTTVVTATSIGMLVEIGGGIMTFHQPFHQLAHITLYFGYFVTAVCAILESYGRLPFDTHRGAQVVSYVAAYLMWYSHGTMKQLPVDQTLHILLAYINLVSAIVIIYSMRFTDSILACVSSWVLLILQGIWLLIAGAYECCIDLPMHEIATYLAILSLLVVLAVTLIYAAFGPPAANQRKSIEYRGDFSPLKTSCDHDLEDNETY